MPLETGASWRRGGSSSTEVRWDRSPQGPPGDGVARGSGAAAAWRCPPPIRAFREPRGSGPSPTPEMTGPGSAPRAPRGQRRRRARTAEARRAGTGQGGPAWVGRGAGPAPTSVWVGRVPRPGRAPQLFTARPSWGVSGGRAGRGGVMGFCRSPSESGRGCGLTTSGMGLAAGHTAHGAQLLPCTLTQSQTLAPRGPWTGSSSRAPVASSSRSSLHAGSCHTSGGLSRLQAEVRGQADQPSEQTRTPTPVQAQHLPPPFRHVRAARAREKRGARAHPPLNGQAAQTGFDVRQLGPPGLLPLSRPQAGSAVVTRGHTCVRSLRLLPSTQVSAARQRAGTSDPGPGNRAGFGGPRGRPAAWWACFPASSLRTSSLANSRNVFRLGVGPGKTLPRKPALGLGAEPPPPQAAGRDPGPLAGMEGAVQLLAVRPPTSCLC